MHEALEIIEANATPYISKSSGISRELLDFRKLVEQDQDTLIEQSPFDLHNKLLQQINFLAILCIPHTFQKKLQITRYASS